MLRHVGDIDASRALQAHRITFFAGDCDDTVPDDMTELKWEFDEDSRRYYVSFPDDQ